MSATLCLNSCQSFIVHETAIPPEQPVPEPTQAIDSLIHEKIDRLLDEASLAFREDRLTTPLDDNAYFCYLRILSMDPKNRRAEQGLTEIVEKYLEWAIEAAERQRFRTALDFLNKAHSIDEIHPNINAVAKLIEDRRLVTHEIYTLGAGALKLRQCELIDELHSIARQIELKQATIIITARNDPEGRWIYQKLNEATDARIQATFEVGQTPNIHLLFRAGTNQEADRELRP